MRLKKLTDLFGADLRSLAAFRVGVALCLLVDLATRATDLTAHYTDRGVLPRAVLLETVGHLWHVSIHLISGTVLVQSLLFLLAAAFAFALLVGYRTRFATAASWCFLISLHARNPMVLQAGDVLLRMLVFWGMFLPLGARWSIDQLLAPPSQRLPHRTLSMATTALLIQVALVYWFTAVLKSGPEWREGSAVYFALSIDQMTTPLGRFLLQFPSVLSALTRSVFWFEVAGGCLLFCPIRTAAVRMLVVIGFWLMHLGFGMSMELGLFPWISSVAMLPFVPDRWWNARPVRRRLRQLERASSSGMRLASRFVSWLGLPLNRQPLLIASSPLANTLAASVLAYVLCWNAGMLERTSFLLPQDSKWIGLLLRLDQKWDMFAPYPMKNDGWFVIPATLKNQRQVDLWSNGGPVRWEKPPDVAATFKNSRWRKYTESLRKEENEEQLLHFSRYLCRSWNNSLHRDAEQVEEFRVYFMLEKTQLESRVEEPKKVLLWHHWCFKKPPGV